MSPKPFLVTLEALRAWLIANPDADYGPFLKTQGWNPNAFDYECDSRAGVPTEGWVPMTKGAPAFHNPKKPAFTIELESDGSAWYIARGLKIKGEFPTFVKAVAYVRSLA